MIFQIPTRVDKHFRDSKILFSTDWSPNSHDSRALSICPLCEKGLTLPLLQIVEIFMKNIYLPRIKCLTFSNVWEVWWTWALESLFSIRNSHFKVVQSKIVTWRKARVNNIQVASASSHFCLWEDSHISSQPFLSPPDIPSHLLI